MKTTWLSLCACAISPRCAHNDAISGWQGDKQLGHSSPTRRPSNADDQPAQLGRLRDAVAEFRKHYRFGRQARHAFAVCDMATHFILRSSWARLSKPTPAGCIQELVSNLIPNSHLFAAGVVATNRAQELYGHALLTALTWARPLNQVHASDSERPHPSPHWAAAVRHCRRDVVSVVCGQSPPRHLVGLRGHLQSCPRPVASPGCRVNGRAWRLPFLVGLLLGGCVGGACAAVGIRSRRLACSTRGSASVPGKLAWMFVGGAFIGFGTRLANGCTSGHGIFRSFEFRALELLPLTFMTSGILTTQLSTRDSSEDPDGLAARW